MAREKKLQDLLSRIESEVEEEIKKIESSFKEKKKELRKEFEEKKEKYIQDEKNKYNSQGELEKTKMISAARLGARKKILNAKREIIEGVFDKALEKIHRLKKADFRRLVQNLLEKMVLTGEENIIPSAQMEVFTPSFIKKINSEKGWNLKLKKDDRDFQGWFIVEGENYSALASAQAVKEHLKELYEGMAVDELFS